MTAHVDSDLLALGHVEPAAKVPVFCHVKGYFVFGGLVHGLLELIAAVEVIPDFGVVVDCAVCLRGGGQRKGANQSDQDRCKATK